MRIEGLQTQINGTVSQKKEPIQQRSFSGNEKVQISGATGERSRTSALIMMQKAQTIVSQALSVSSRLKSMATETMTTGESNSTEITNEIVSIDVQLGQFGSKVLDVPHTKDETIPLDQIKQDVEALKTASQSENLNKQDIQQIETRLSVVNDKLDSMINVESERLSEQKLSKLDPVSFTRETSEMITKNPTIALAAQGNVLAANAYSLT